MADTNMKTLGNRDLSKIRWSYSRRSTFEQCPRKYYLSYYGHRNDQVVSDSDKEQIKFLHDIPNRHLRIGSIAHLVIRTFFKRAQKGDVWNAQRLIKWAAKMLIEDRYQSRKNPDGTHWPNIKYPPKLLLEHYYGHADVERDYDEAANKLKIAIMNFATSPAFQTFLENGVREGALVEHWMDIPDFPCGVIGQIDLAYKNDDVVTVVDWKIGQDDGQGEDSLQLAAYALWAVTHFNVPAEKVQVYKAFLSSEECVPFTIDASKLEAAKIRIIQDADRMSAMEDYGQRAIKAAFTPCYQPKICHLCSFQELCYGE
ncbi:MAG: PD-(D/E)XK nuclease family protein [Chloroflexota bacterium]